MAKGFKKASRTQIIKINDALKEILIVHDSGFCSYKEGFSDDTVAITTGATRASVEGVRREMFGNLAVGATRSADKSRLEELTKVVDNIVGCYDELKNRFNTLIKIMALNKVADVKHLEIK